MDYCADPSTSGMVRCMKHKASARRNEPAPSNGNAVAGRRPAIAAVESSAEAAGLGVLAGLGPAGEAWVDVPRQRRRNVPARSTVALLPEHVGREVLLTWVEGGSEPVISGVIRRTGDTEREAGAPRLEALVDAERIVLTGQREVVLRCGQASILLSADGAIVIKGAKVLTSATGVHRIRGGAVQIN
jgi:uncharacterized protein DUF6484